MITNSSNAFSNYSEEELLRDGYNRAVRTGYKDPICPFLPATKEHKQWMKGYNKALDEHIEKERNNNGN